MVAGKARELYGDELVEVLLYGSRARGDHCPESGPRHPAGEESATLRRDPLREQLGDFVHIDLATNSSSWCLVSLYASSVEQVRTWDTTFYRNVRADAVEVP